MKSFARGFSLILLIHVFPPLAKGDADNLSATTVNQKLQEFKQAYSCLQSSTRAYYQPGNRNGQSRSGPPFVDVGTIALLEQECGWTEEEPLDFAAQWLYLDYEFARRDMSTRNFPALVLRKQFMVVDQNGFEYLPQKFAEENGLCSGATGGS